MGISEETEETKLTFFMTRVREKIRFKVLGILGNSLVYPVMWSTKNGNDGKKKHGGEPVFDLIP